MANIQQPSFEESVKAGLETGGINKTNKVSYEFESISDLPPMAEVISEMEEAGSRRDATIQVASEEKVSPRITTITRGLSEIKEKYVY
jgi:hypothetical protein